jgi:hypothetical protein
MTLKFDQDPLDLHSFADDDTRLAASAERLDAERADLEKECDELRRELAVARHLGDGDPEALEARESQVDERLDEIERQLAEIATARAEVARRSIAASRHEVEGLLEGRRRSELELTAEVGRLAEEYAAAHHRLDQAVAIRKCAEAEVREIEADERALDAALAEGRTDGLAAIRQRRDRKRLDGLNRTLAAWREGRLDDRELTDAERSYIRRADDAAARVQAERERVAREAGTFPITVEELEAAQHLPDYVPQHEHFPRIPGV